MGVFYSFNGVGEIFISAVAAGLYDHKDSYAIKSYKVLFLIIGSMTIAIGIAILFIMPDTPDKAWWLNDREKAVIIQRIRGNNQGFGNKKFKWDQARECLLDVKTYIYLLLTLAVGIPNSGISSFGAIIIENMGYETVKALLMKSPTGAFNLVALAALPTLGRINKSRIFWGIVYMVISLMSVALIAFAPQHSAQCAGIWIYGISPVGMILVTSCVTSNTAGHTKKLLTNALTLACYAAGNTIGPQTFRSSDAPLYHKAKATVVGCIAAAVVIICILYADYIYENKKRDKNDQEKGTDYLNIPNLEFADLTDKENPEFRYRT